MKKLAPLVILALATWRLSSLLVREDGPFDVFGKFRSAVGVKYDEHSRPYGTNPVAEALTCLWCTSIWSSTFLCLIGRIPHGHWIVTLLAGSAGAILVDESIDAIGR